jgi:anthranilate synthase/aminodeoxychorismate synthase-like glutamine amidotransferase
MKNKLRILLVDNFDSFTYNLEHYLILAGAQVSTFRNNQIPFGDILDDYYDGVVISPGPGRPEQSGDLMQLMDLLYRKKEMPALGICLGMQAMGLHVGMNLIHAPLPVHGKTARITHTGKGIFERITSVAQVMRYHSLVLTDLADSVIISARTIEDDLIMGIEFLDRLWTGVQFHPESILTPEGQLMLSNWLTFSHEP